MQAVACGELRLCHGVSELRRSFSNTGATFCSHGIGLLAGSLGVIPTCARYVVQLR